MREYRLTLISLYLKKNNKINNKSPYTQEIIPNLNQKEKKTEYVYNPADNINNRQLSIVNLQCFCCCRPQRLY